MLVKILHGRYLLKRNTEIYRSMLIKCTTFRISRWNNVDRIPGTLLNNPGDSIKAIYTTQVTLLLTDILLLVFFAKIHFVMLPAKILF